METILLNCLNFILGTTYEYRVVCWPLFLVVFSYLLSRKLANKEWMYAFSFFLWSFFEILGFVTFLLIIIEFYLADNTEGLMVIAKFLAALPILTLSIVIALLRPKK